MIETMQEALRNLGAFATVGLAATGSALGCGAAACSAIGGWKKCYALGKPAPFQLTVLTGVPMSQTIYGLIVMLQVLSIPAGFWPAALAIGIFGGLGIGTSAALQGRAAAGACDAFTETKQGFVNYLLALGIVETIAIFVMIFAIMFMGKFK